MPSIDRRKAIFIDESKGLNFRPWDRLGQSPVHGKATYFLTVELAGTRPHSHGQKPRIEHQLHASPNSGIFYVKCTSVYVIVCVYINTYICTYIYIYVHYNVDALDVIVC
jgi:hypothetical protein